MLAGIDRSKKTIGVMALVVLALIAVRFGCNRLSFAEADKKVTISLPPPVPAGGDPKMAPPAFVVQRLEAQTITKTMRVTAYCPCRKCCWPFADGITASGWPACPGALFCAADPSIPFGTCIEIPGYSKLGVMVLDRGGAIKGDRLDVLFYDGDLKTSHARARAWGVQYLECRIYK